MSSAAAMASSAGALLRRGRHRCPSPPWPRPCSSCWCWLPSPRRSPARPRSRRRRSSRRCSLQAFRPHERALGWRDGREMGAWGSREERRERDGAVTGERRRVRAERSQLVRQISWGRANPHLHRIYLSRSAPSPDASIQTLQKEVRPIRVGLLLPTKHTVGVWDIFIS